MVQSNVYPVQNPGEPGDFFDNSARVVRGAIVTSGGIIGNAVTYVDESADPTRVVGGGSGTFAGIIVNAKEMVRNSALSAGLGVTVEGRAAICTHGDVWVKVVGTVSPELTPICVYSNGTINGWDFENEVSPADAMRIPGARFLTAASSGGMAILRLNN